MEEQLISFETAVLAKEKGFEYKERFFAHFHSDKNKLSTWTPDDWDIQNSSAWRDLEIPAPTQTLLQKWLREVHGIHVQPFYHPNTISTREIKPEVEIVRVFAKDGITKSILPPSLRNEEFDTYEQAFEKGLLAALKLIQ